MQHGARGGHSPRIHHMSNHGFLFLDSECSSLSWVFVWDGFNVLIQLTWVVHSRTSSVNLGQSGVTVLGNGDTF